MAQTFYLRSTAGVACGPGDREDLVGGAGASAATKALDTTGDTWNRTISPAQTFYPGSWTFITDITVAAGAGPDNKIVWTIERRNSSCVVQETIMSETSAALTKGATAEYSASVAAGKVDFADGDILVAYVQDGLGSQAKTIRYNDGVGTNADSRVILPPDRRTFAVS